MEDYYKQAVILSLLPTSFFLNYLDMLRIILNYTCSRQYKEKKASLGGKPGIRADKKIRQPKENPSGKGKPNRIN